jgi:hypothetical protein
LDPLGTAATNRPIVPAPDDYDDGEIGGIMIGRGNRSTQEKTCGRRGGKSATNRLSYGRAFFFFFFLLLPKWGARGSVVVKALCCKPEGRGFKSR